MPIIAVVILVHSHQDKAKQEKTRQDKGRQVKTRRNIHRFVAYNDNDNNNDNHNDYHYSMNSDGIKIIS